MDSSAKQTLKIFNEIIKENNNIYRKVAKRFNLSECTFWILYSIKTSDKDLTQKDLIISLHLPKQTINTSLIKLKEEGILYLEQSNDHRLKYIKLTDKGILLSQQSIEVVIDKEIQALSTFTNEEHKTLLNILRKYNQELDVNFKNI